MSRIGKMPIPVPKGADIQIGADQITVKGPLGTLTQALTPAAGIVREGDELLVKPGNDSVEANAMSGTLRAVVANMVTGVTKGFERRLTLVGVGYRAQAQGNALNLSLGFSHPVVHQMPEGVKAETPTQTEIVIKGARQAESRPGRSRSTRIPSAGALQGQGRALCRREGRPERDQEEVT